MALNRAAAERALRRIERDLLRLIETDPDHAERIRAMLPAAAGTPTPDPIVPEPGDVVDPAAESTNVAVTPVPPQPARARKATKAKTPKTPG